MIDNEEGILKKIWYVFLVVVLGAFYFTLAIAEGLWGWAKEKLTK